MGQLHHIAHFFHDFQIILTAVGFEAIGAILDALGGICKSTAAVFAQAVQRAIAEEATEGCGVCVFMAGEVFTFLILKKIVIWHNQPHCNSIQ